jgi:hypothetical protein
VKHLIKKIEGKTLEYEIVCFNIGAHSKQKALKVFMNTFYGGKQEILSLLYLKLRLPVASLQLVEKYLQHVYVVLGYTIMYGAC